ncbi:MAG TPA: hypothetical protein VGP47_07375 [Parachlamydiaceae bacterium]|nr:hypothetical protein [Parachlamydiaceae bacterium]
MNKSEKKRLCWNCEGSVSISEETCPFCGVSVIPAFLEGAGAEFAPPYSNHSVSDFGIPKSPFAMNDENVEAESPTATKEIDDTEPLLDEFKRVAIAVTLLLSGSVFFMFSMALGLFSHNDILTLRWDGSYWYIYTVVALPLLFIGWRSLMKLDSP